MGDTKEALLDAAFHIFNDKGYHQARISDIVKQAGVSQGTFYLYFNNKEAIFIDLSSQFLSRLLDELESLKETWSTFSPSERLRGMIRHGLMFTYENRTLMNLIMTYSDATPMIKESCAMREQQLKRVLREAIEPFEPYRSMTSYELDVAAMAIDGMIETVAYDCFVVQEKDHTSIDILVDVIVRMLTKGEEID